jgi:FkbM family methyltransferase
MLEQHYYRRPLYDFMSATVANPDILIDAELDGGSVVVDAGAYVGEWSERVSDRYGSQIYAFEPNPEVAPELEARLGEHDNVRWFGHGLGAADFTATLALRGPGSSIFTNASEPNTATVKIRDVVAVFDELGIEQIDLMKLNIEGAEYDLLERLDTSDWLQRIDFVSVQFHEWHPHAYRRRRAARRSLARHHVECWNYPWVWELWRRR